MKRLKLTSDRKSRSTRTRKAAKPADPIVKSMETIQPVTITEVPELEHICDGTVIPDAETIQTVESLKADTVEEIQGAATAIAAITAAEAAKPEPNGHAPKGAVELLARAESIEGPISAKNGKVNQLRLRVDGAIRWAWLTPAISELVREVARDEKTVRYERVSTQV